MKTQNRLIFNVNTILWAMIQANGYCMVSNFHGVQIFMDFMCSAYPRKTPEFQLYN